MNHVHPKPLTPQSWLPSIGVLGLPLLWFVHQQVNYLLVPWACRTGHVWVFHAVSAAMLAISGGYLVATVRHWRTTRDEDHDLVDAVPHRRHLFATLAAALSAIFTFAILLQWLPILFLGPCSR